MIFLRQACAAIVSRHAHARHAECRDGGLIEWAKSHLPEARKRSAPGVPPWLVVRFTSLIICLHIMEILLWTAFYRWTLLEHLGVGFLLFGDQLFDGGLWDVVLQPLWRLSGRRKCFRCAHVRTVGELLFAVVARLIESSESARAIGERRRCTVSSRIALNPKSAQPAMLPAENHRLGNLGCARPSLRSRRQSDRTSPPPQPSWSTITRRSALTGCPSPGVAGFAFDASSTPARIRTVRSRVSQIKRSCATCKTPSTKMNR